MTNEHSIITVAGVTRVLKVQAYILHRGRLLVFKHRDHPEAGIQVPSGTVRVGESLEEAALREASEETGLDDLELDFYLHYYDHDVPLHLARSIPPGHELQRRHVFQFSVVLEAPETWAHWERDDEGRLAYAFEFFWVAPEQARGLIGTQAALLDRLK